MSESGLYFCAANVGELFPEKDSEQLTPEQLAEYKRTVELAVGGDKGAIAELYHSSVLSQIAGHVARMISGASYWDQAMSKEDIVHMAVCEILSACTYMTINELRSLLYTAAKNNVIDIVRRQRIVRFEPLSEASDRASGDSIQTELERNEMLSAWKAQLESWFVRLNRIDQIILRGAINGTLPREIARSLYEGDWTKLSLEERKQYSDKISKRLYKLKEKLATWIKSSELTRSG